MRLDTALALVLLVSAVQGQEASPSLRVGEPLSGVLGDSAQVIRSEVLDTYPAPPTIGREYSVAVEETGKYRFELRSHFFDGYLVLRDEGGAVLAEDDDGLVGMHPRIVVQLDGGRPYRIQACSLRGESGAFELRLEKGEPPPLTAPGRALAEREDLEARMRAIEQGSGGNDLAAVESLVGQVAVYKQKGDYDAARACQARVHALHEAAFGPEHPTTAASLHDLAYILMEQGDYAEARVHFERALAIREAVLGPEHPDTAVSLNDMGLLLYYTGDFAGASELYERAYLIREEALGAEHLETAMTLANLSSILVARADLDGAQALCERVLAIFQAELGPEDPMTGTAFNNLGVVLERKGEYRAAIPVHEQGLSIIEKSLGPEHIETAKSVNNLAVLYWELGDYEAAQPLYERALAVFEKTLGPDHPDTAKQFNNLAHLLFRRGDYETARELHERALDIRERALGAQHPDTGISYNNLAQVLHDQGNFDEARLLYEQAIAILETTAGRNHPSTVNVRTNLSGLLWEQGDYGAARRLLEESLAARERSLGPSHPLVGLSLNNLAAMLRSQGDYEGAQSLHERALAIVEKLEGPEHPNTARSLNNLGFVLRLQGKHAEALALHRRALAIDERVLGWQHADTAMSVQRVAEGLVRGGDLSEARALYERAVATYEDELGPQHPKTVECLAKHSLLLLDLGEPRTAWDTARRGLVSRDLHRARILSSLTEGERYAYLARVQGQVELQLVLAPLLDDPEAMRLAYQTLLEWKGQLARLLQVSRKRLLVEATPEQRAVLVELRSHQKRLSALVTGAVDPGGAGSEDELRALRQKVAKLELALLREGQEQVVRPESTSFLALRSSLPRDACVLDFFLHRKRVPAERTDGEFVRPGSWAEERVAVWITRSDGEAPILLDLGGAQELQAVVRDYLGGLTATRSGGGATDAFARAGGALRAALWDPLEPYLDGIETVFVSPDGFLGTLPFEAIPLVDGSWLVEQHGFVYLQDVSSLAQDRPASQVELDSMLIVGGVNFGGEWEELTATEYEAQVVFELHEEARAEQGRRLLLQGAEPTEERLKRELSSFDVLHLATHGFFHSDGTLSFPHASVECSGEPGDGPSAEAVELIGKHPGLLSGLVLAGAGTKTASDEDGYLTAEEVGWLDLSAVELVVLSACDTGLGLAHSGEGLIGLRRAFQTSGVKTVVSSLWSVRDESTAALMREFYRNLLQRGMGRLEALRSAQLSMLARNRERTGDGIPSSWGAFVLSGEWR